MRTGAHPSNKEASNIEEELTVLPAEATRGTFASMQNVYQALAENMEQHMCTRPFCMGQQRCELRDDALNGGLCQLGLVPRLLAYLLK